jgi:hypothetical protein
MFHFVHEEEFVPIKQLYLDVLNACAKLCLTVYLTFKAFSSGLCAR